jgi:hypothetical protein
MERTRVIRRREDEHRDPEALEPGPVQTQMQFEHDNEADMECGDDCGHPFQHFHGLSPAESRWVIGTVMQDGGCERDRSPRLSKQE